MTDYTPESDIAAYLDKKFGKGKWRFTSEFRSEGDEDRLRARGAGTVPAGELSAHSKGKPGAAGAVDLKVNDMSDEEVAAALKDGPFTKAFAEGRHGPEGSHVHAEPIPALPPGFKLDSDPAVAGHDESATPPLPKGFKLDALPAGLPDGAQQATEDAITGAIPKRKTPLQRAGEVAQTAGADVAKVAGNFEEDIAARSHSAQAQAAADIMPANTLKAAVQQGVRRSAGPITAAEDVMNLAGAPIQGAVDTIIGRPVEVLTGGRVSRQQAGDVASLALPFVGEGLEQTALARRAAEMGVSPEALQANEAARVAAGKTNTLKAVAKRPVSSDPDYAAAVGRLEGDGVKVPLHQRAGGQAARLAESGKADPYVGPGIRSAEQVGADTFNTALYNKVLAPIDDRVPATVKPGRDGVKFVKEALGSAYQRVLPHVKATGDAQLTSDLAQTRTSVAKLGAPQAQQYEAILNQDVLHHFGPEGMDGKTYKSVVSDLLRQARGFKGSQDPNQRGLGYALEDTVAALQGDMIRSSPPKYASELKNINESYALYARLRDAATTRRGSAGEITPGDLLTAVRRGDKSVGKGDFATGDALLQQFAEDGDKVLTPKHGTSHTPEIINNLNFLRGHGMAGAALGGAMGMGGGVEGSAIGASVGGAADIALARLTNLATRRALTGGRGVQPANYLRAVTRRPPATLLAAPTAVSAGQQQ